MRLPIIVTVLLSFSLSLAAPVVAADRSFGSGVGAGEVVTALDLAAHPEDYLGKKVRVSGRITAVCPRRGCWIDIGGEGATQTVRFKVEDGVIVFPADVNGKPVVAEGVLVKHELGHEQAVAWTRHLAEERGEEFDPSSVTGPLTLYEIQGAGAVVRDGP